MDVRWQQRWRIPLQPLCLKAANNLTVIANRLTALDEIAGVAFFDRSDELMAMSGVQQAETSFEAQATIDDTRSGYVQVTLNRDAFAPPIPWVLWLLSLLSVLLTPPSL